MIIVVMGKSTQSYVRIFGECETFSVNNVLEGLLW